MSNLSIYIMVSAMYSFSFLQYAKTEDQKLEPGKALEGGYATPRSPITVTLVETLHFTGLCDDITQSYAVFEVRTTLLQWLRFATVRLAGAFTLGYHELPNTAFVVSVTIKLIVQLILALRLTLSNPYSVPASSDCSAVTRSTLANTCETAWQWWAWPNYISWPAD